MWAQEFGLLDGNALSGTLAFADVVKETNVSANCEGSFRRH
jgi:hypothetical protein